MLERCPQACLSASLTKSLWDRGTLLQQAGTFGHDDIACLQPALHDGRSFPAPWPVPKPPRPPATSSWPFAGRRRTPPCCRRASACCRRSCGRWPRPPRRCARWPRPFPVPPCPLPTFAPSSMHTSVMVPLTCGRISTLCRPSTTAVYSRVSVRSVGLSVNVLYCAPPLCCGASLHAARHTRHRPQTVVRPNNLVILVITYSIEIYSIEIGGKVTGQQMGDSRPNPY